MSAVEDLYNAMVAANVDPISGRAIVIFAAKTGKAIGIIGRHSSTGLCWCQPLYDSRSEIFIHKRVMDMDDDKWDEAHEGTWSQGPYGVVPNDQDTADEQLVRGLPPLV